MERTEPQNDKTVLTEDTRDGEKEKRQGQEVKFRGPRPKPDRVLPYTPPVENEEHKRMFAYYSALGKNRTLQQVAKSFGRSVSYVANISRAFKWRERILSNEISSDPFGHEIEQEVQDARRKLIFVIHDIIDTLYQIAYISKEYKDNAGKSKRNFPRSLQRRITRLQEALKFYGFDIQGARDIKALLSTMQDVLEFSPVIQRDEYSQGDNVSLNQFNINNATLVIQEE